MEKINLKISKDDDEVGYLYLPNHPRDGRSGISKKQIELSSLIEGYKGPEIILDFDAENTLIGIEILA